MTHPEGMPGPDVTGQWEIGYDAAADRITVRFLSWREDVMRWQDVTLVPEAAYRFFLQGLFQTLGAHPELSELGLGDIGPT